MPEVQRHGFDFENWVKETFFTKSHINYTEKWDVPPELNVSIAVPGDLRRLPVSIKTCKYGSSIGFGDAVRQFENEEDFLLIVGFWKQSGAYKNFVAVEAVKIIVEEWQTLFLPLIEKDEVRKLDSIIKNRTIDYWEARKQAKEAKKSDSFKSARIVLNPKIDSKDQRRLQCSLPFSTFWSNFAKKAPYADENCELFGQKVPNPFLSAIRTFGQT